MNPLFILAIIQGLTEFLPVSSSGHLVLAKILLGYNERGIEMETWVHFGTLAALIAYFAKDLFGLAGAALRKEGASERRWILYIFVSTLITGVVGILWHDKLEAAFSNLRLTLAGFVVTGLLLVATRWSRESRAELRFSDAVWFGAAQAFAILPSISRSGATIACLMFLGVNRGVAFRYSFIASIPAIGGALLLEALHGSFAAFTPVELAGSFALSAVFGLASLWVLRRFVVRNRLLGFGVYCIAIGVIGLAIGLLPR